MTNKGYKQSEETRKKHSLSIMGKNNPNYGKHLSSEAKLNISNANKGRITMGFSGRKHTDESRKKIGLSGIGRKFTKDAKQKISRANKERVWSDVSKLKISLSRIGKSSWNKGRCHSDQTKQKIKIKRSEQVIPVKDTSIEVQIQNYLKQLRIEFLTHQYIKDIEHGYQCDILIPSMNLVIECDGNYWHNYPIGSDLDHIRTKELLEKGFKVLRLWEHEIKLMSIDDFENKLKLEIER